MPLPQSWDDAGVLWLDPNDWVTQYQIGLAERAAWANHYAAGASEKKPLEVGWGTVLVAALVAGFCGYGLGGASESQKCDKDFSKEVLRQERKCRERKSHT